MRDLDLSQVDLKASVSDLVSDNVDENKSNKKVIAVDSGNELKSTGTGGNDFQEPESFIPDDRTASGNDSILREAAKSSLKIDGKNNDDQSTYTGPEQSISEEDGLRRTVKLKVQLSSLL